MTRLEEARARHAQRHQTRTAIRAAIDALVETAGHKPATTLTMILETAIDDLQHVGGDACAVRQLQRERERVAGGYGLDA